MMALAPLAMSQTKEELLKHLNMAPEIYSMMAKETDRIYRWLTSENCHLKKNCKRKPPYDWSDIMENSKDEAMKRIAESGDQITSYYWNLAAATEHCPNWIARWFLYHKFRYRDGRNRNALRGEDGKQSHHNRSSKHHHGSHQSVVSPETGYCSGEASNYSAGDMGLGSNVPAYSYGAPSNTVEYGEASNVYAYQNYNVSGYEEQGHSDGQTANKYYDPIRDLRMPGS